MQGKGIWSLADDNFFRFIFTVGSCLASFSQSFSFSSLITELVFDFLPLFLDTFMLHDSFNGALLRCFAQHVVMRLGVYHLLQARKTCEDDLVFKVNGIKTG